MKVLIIGYVWPELRSSAAGLRSWNLVHTFLSAGWEVVFSSGSKLNAYSTELQELGVQIHTFIPNDPAFDPFIAALQPDFVIFDRFVIEEQFGWRVLEHCPQAVRILDVQDLHFLRKQRELALSLGQSLEEIKDCQIDLISETTLRELGSIHRSDATLVLSSFEQDLLVNRFQIPSQKIGLTRFHYPSPSETLPSYEERSHFAVIGNFRHPPNVDGVRWLFNEIWPLIRTELPMAELHLYGAYPSKEIMSLCRSELGFLVKGSIRDPFEMMKQVRVNLAPLRYGAGIKGKVSDGWFVGTPAVGTSIAAEGMCPSELWGGAIANDPCLFAQKAIELYQSQEKWQTASQKGRRLIQTLYSKEEESKHLLETLLRLREQIHQTRKTNLMGLILSHHHYQSTKYFSKWIEAKNAHKNLP